MIFPVLTHPARRSMRCPARGPAGFRHAPGRPSLAPRNRRNSGWTCALGLCFVIGLLLTGSPARGDDPERPDPPIEVNSWSVWVGSPAQNTLNSARIYRNAFPDSVGTSRHKAAEKDQAHQFPIAPITVVQVFGQPCRDVDIDLRIAKGTLLAHWPRGEDRGGRIQWFKSDLLQAAPPDLPPGFLSEAHWLQKLRNLGAALYVKNESHVERFLAADMELALPVPVKLRGGPDAYTLQNLSPHRLLDVAVVVPTETGYRVGWLDELPAAVPESAEKPREEPPQRKGNLEQAEAVFQQAELDAKSPAQDPARPRPIPAEGDPDIRARVDQVLNRQVTQNGETLSRRAAIELITGQARLRSEIDEPALAKAEVDLTKTVTLAPGSIAARDALADVLSAAGLSYRVTETGTLFITTAARLAEVAGKSGTVLEGPPVTITLSQPLKPANPSYRELTRDSYARRLARQGLREEAAQALLDQYSQPLFEPNELIVLAHLSREGLDEAVQLDVFPTPKTLVRTALVVAHGIDPRLQDRARDLVRRLGDPAPRTRDTAESQLFDLGAVAIPALEDALGDKDIEIVFRSERLLMRLNRPVP